jgi:hypothetical protein
MRMIALIASTLTLCLVAILAYLSVESSRQARREHERQEAIRQFDEEQRREFAEGQARQRPLRGEQSLEKSEWHALDPIDEDVEIANLKSPDRDVLRVAIQRLQLHRICRAVPDLLEILKTTSSDRIAGFAARAITGCKQPSTYPTVVDEFLQRSATPSLILAVGETGSQDDRVYAKLHRLITEPNSDQLVPDSARHATQQIDIQTQLGAPGR